MCDCNIKKLDVKKPVKVATEKEANVIAKRVRGKSDAFAQRVSGSSKSFSKKVLGK